MTFDAANEWLRSRVTVPTDMTTREMALAPDFDARVRAHSFFSAQVDKANALEAIREQLDAYVAGDIDLATARWHAKTALTRLGYAADDVGMTDTPPAGMDPDTWRRRKAITNLASTRRLDLILRQNARMAWAVGRKQVSEDPAVKARWPFYRYIARDDARPEHAALDGLVLPKDDPFWATHTPPWDFNCRCDIEDADDADAARSGGLGQAVTREEPDGAQSATVVNPATGAAREILPPESGFVFRSDEPLHTLEMSRIRNIPMRGAVMQGLRNLARTTGARFNCTLRDALNGPALAGAKMKTAKSLIDEAAEAVRAGRDVPATEAQIGRLSGELTEALGLDADVVKLGGGKVGKKASDYGFQHQIARHREELLNGDMQEALYETLFAESGVRASVGFNGGQMYLDLASPGTGALTTCKRVGDEWQVTSAAPRAAEYLKRQTGVMKKGRGRE
jgi:SPP1 gp7 family putative phage head morphogenesis protein